MSITSEEYLHKKGLTANMMDKNIKIKVTQINNMLKEFASLQTKNNGNQKYTYFDSFKNILGIK